MVAGDKRAYFDSIAARWDGWEDLASLPGRLRAGLMELAMLPGETVVDLGCGTGNLTGVLAEMVGERGRVLAVDFSPGMLAQAQAKITAPQVHWFCDDAACLPVADQSVDHVVCFSVWPHFNDASRVADEIFRLLKPGGNLHIWHLAGRETINEIHHGQGQPIGMDLLPPAIDLSQLLQDAGFEIQLITDEKERYLISARKPRLAGASAINL